MYEKSLLAASARTGVAPTALAAIVGAEATPGAGGVWDPHSQAPGSSARGLTQFLAPTWEGMAQTKGTALHQEAASRGLLDARTGKVAAGRTAELLALRDDPELSIQTAADYAKENLSALRSSGDIPKDLPPGLTARVAYLAHHEGVGGARAFLHNTGERTATMDAAQNAAHKLGQQGLSQSDIRARLSEKGWRSCFRLPQLSGRLCRWQDQGFAVFSRLQIG